MNAFEQVKASQEIIYPGPTAFKSKFDAVAAEIADLYATGCGEYVEASYPELHERIWAATFALNEAWRSRNMPLFLSTLEEWRLLWLNAINLHSQVTPEGIEQ